MNSMIKKIALFAIATLFTLAVNAQSVPETGNLGIRANITGQTNIELPYMLNESLSIAPFFGLNSTENQATTFNIGVRPRYYMNTENAFATYATGTLGLTNTSVNNANASITDFNIGLGYGAEYFFSDHFSVSGDVNLNARVGDSANNLSTLARVSASIYF